MDTEWIERLSVAGAVLLATLIAVKIADRLIARHFKLRPETLTVYRVVRRSVIVVILVVGILSALLVFPAVQAVAGTILASSAIIALIVGLAAQTTLSNFIAGILVAFAQPLRLGDQVVVAGASGTVQQIGVTYTVIRAADGARYYVPNAKLASDTIRNATIAGAEHLISVNVSVPVGADLERVLELLLQEARRLPDDVIVREPNVYVSQVDQSEAVLTVETAARSAAQATELASTLRRSVVDRLKAEGVYG
jgi:small-conductance mechanosensitive channel